MSALVTDSLWKEVEPLLPEQTASPKEGSPPVSNRACLAGIIFVLKTGLPWNALPAEMGCGSGMPCWRLQEWMQLGVWPQLHQRLLRRLGKRGSIRLSRVVIDSASVRAVFGDHIAEKRPLLEIVCLNWTLNDVSLIPEMRKPFDLLAEGLLVSSSRGDRI